QAGQGTTSIAVPSSAGSSRPFTDRPQDEQALQALGRAYAQAFEAGDARALGTLFTDSAELIDEEDEHIQGRARIENYLGTVFQERPGATMNIVPVSRRFLSPDVALEEGRTIVKAPGGSAATSRHYTVMYVKQGDRWRYSVVREELEKAVTPHERLLELEWLVGEWMDESPDSLVHTSCRWTPDGNFLLRDFTIRVQGKPVMTVNERIGWDASRRQIVSWVFDSEGGHGTGCWSRGNNDWIIKSTGVLPDGRTATATHVLTRISDHSARWASVERTVGDRIVADHAEYLMVRRPPPAQGR
ncbi:MAG: YybH family protein, partial [Isosphaeraceae bacterium]